jgi:hypothetical protein
MVIWLADTYLVDLAFACLNLHIVKICISGYLDSLHMLIALEIQGGLVYSKFLVTRQL